MQAPFFLPKNQYFILDLARNSKKNCLQFLTSSDDELGMKHLFFLMSVFFLFSCNPEVQKAGESETDLVKYFKITNRGGDSLGEGYLIVVHVGKKRVLSYYLKNAKGYSHTDITLKPGQVVSYVVDSVYSQTENCKLSPSFEQPRYLEELRIEGNPKVLNLELMKADDAMKMVKTLSCE